MGLASALSTALTGLSAAETTIDVVGNNLANSNTVGFKASQANFATQFLQTLSLGSAPTDNSGGTNPRQTGLGTMVADITPNFSQGTIEISSNPTDMAIQGDGFFVVQGTAGERLYTRNGVFKMNAANEMVTLTGNRVLGFGVNDQFQLQRTVLRPITIPLGSAAVAQATENVYLEGQLSPTGDISTRAAQIQSDILGTDYYSNPLTNLTATESTTRPALGLFGGNSAPAGTMAPGDYWYRFVYATSPMPSPPTTLPPLTEGIPSDAVMATVAPGDGGIALHDIPTPPAVYSNVRIYRSTTQNGTYNYVDEVPSGTANWPDTLGDLTGRPELNNQMLQGEYKYYVTFYNDQTESRPCLINVPDANIQNGRVVLTNIPTPAVGDIWTGRRVYRSLNASESDFRLLRDLSDVTTTVLVDNYADTQLPPTQLNFDGPTIDRATLLVDVLRRDSTGYSNVFRVGTLEFTGEKGGRTLSTKSYEITASSTVGDLLTFMSDALGIQPHTSDPLSPPVSETSVPGVYANPGGDVDNSRMVLTGNNGVENAIDINLSGMNLVYTDPFGNRAVETVNLPWGERQIAIGESAVTDTIVYDTLGIPLSLRVTMALENRNSTETTYRWYADSADNAPTPQHAAAIAVGTGTITFDTTGNFKHSTQSTVNIHRDGFPSVDPLSFDLDFTSISGLATDRSSIAVSRQDGTAPGVLTSFITGEDGRITGVFSNGVSRDLGQIRLVRFANSNGLEQRGQNLFSAGVNSGLPVEGDPGSQGIGSVIAGAVELSNTDIGGNLIDLILASTMYRGNTRVITTAQQMLDELLALRR